MFIAAEQLQKLKTSLFDIIAMVYGIGLITWSIYAYNNSLGIVSAIDSQYFIAGIVPFLFILIIYYSINSKFSFLVKLLNKGRSALKKIVRDKTKTVVFSSFVFLSIIVFFIYLALTESTYLWIFVAAYTGLYIFSIYRFYNPKPKTNSNFKIIRNSYRLINPQFFLVGYTKFLITLFSLFLVFMYSVFIYPEIPQELGGAKPKFAFFESKKGVYNDSTTIELFKDTSGIVLRSKPALIYYYNNDKIILKIYESSKVYELNRRDIALIDWEK